MSLKVKQQEEKNQQRQSRKKGIQSILGIYVYKMRRGSHDGKGGTEGRSAFCFLTLLFGLDTLRASACLARFSWSCCSWVSICSCCAMKSDVPGLCNERVSYCK